MPLYLNSMLEQPLLIQRVWSMPNGRPYQIKAIATLIKEECRDDFLDVFPFGRQVDVLAHLKTIANGRIENAVIDPPYSPRQAKEEYKLDLDAVEFTKYLSRVQDELSRVIRPGGMAISLGWNSNGLGKSRGFKLKKILLVAHGAHHNDTIVTVERKVNGSLFPHSP